MKKNIVKIITLFFSCTPIYAATTQEIFTQIYEQGQWFVDETYSGQGSRLVETPVIRERLPELLKELKVRTLLDAGCGDFNWLKVTQLSVDLYIGVDIVPSLIANNKQRYENEKRRFLHRNIISDVLPKADAILCRDVLNHLPYQDIVKVIKNFKQSGAKYLIVTIQAIKENGVELQAPGPWRALNFLRDPFNFSSPKYIIYEGGYEGNTGKSLAVWALDDLFEDLKLRIIEQSRAKNTLPYHEYLNPNASLEYACPQKTTLLDNPFYLNQARVFQDTFERIPLSINGEQCQIKTVENFATLHVEFNPFKESNSREDCDLFHEAFKYLYQKNSPEKIQPSPHYIIPPIIHQIWVGPKSREKYEKFRQTWIKKHPGWLYKLWTDADLKKLRLINQNFYDDTNCYAEKADYLRYEILYLFGGVFADMDTECVQSFEPLNRRYSFYAGVLTPYLVTNSIIAATPRHPIIKQCIATVNIDSRGLPYGSGPVQLTKSFLLAVPLCKDPVIALPPTYFSPPIKDGLLAEREVVEGAIRPETFSIHYSAADWF